MTAGDWCRVQLPYRAHPGKGLSALTMSALRCTGGGSQSALGMHVAEPKGCICSQHAEYRAG